MKAANYISNMAVPSIIFIIVLFGVLEKKNVFDLFISGAKDGLKITYKLFPTLVGIFLAIGMLRESGVINLCTNFISSVANMVGIPAPLVPLALIRPISGSASIGVAVDIMKQFGVSSFIGIAASVIMGSTETTLYILAVYTGYIKVYKNRCILVAALIADAVGIITAVAFCRLLS